MFLYFFRFLLILYLLFFPVKRLKVTIFVLSMVQCLSLLLISAAHLFPSMAELLLLIGFAGIGAGKANLSLSSLLTIENINAT